MSSTTTVAEFAAELNKPTATLIEQLTSAGVAKAQADDKLSESDKQKLLSYLQSSHGTASTERKKITLVKKSTTEIKQAEPLAAPAPFRWRCVKNVLLSSAMTSPTKQPKLQAQPLKQKMLT